MLNTLVTLFLQLKIENSLVYSKFKILSFTLEQFKIFQQEIFMKIEYSKIALACPVWKNK